MEAYTTGVNRLHWAPAHVEAPDDQTRAACGRKIAGGARATHDDDFGADRAGRCRLCWRAWKGAGR